jgi:hypothetical protein
VRYYLSRGSKLVSFETLDRRMNNRRVFWVLFFALMAANCNFELGHAVPRDHTIGAISPPEAAGIFAFTARGHGTQFTLASPERLTLPRGSNIHLLLTDRSHAVIAGADLNGETLRSTNWDGSNNSVLLEPLPDLDTRLLNGQTYQLEVSVTPATVVAHPLHLVQHWQSEHGE